MAVEMGGAGEAEEEMDQSTEVEDAVGILAVAGHRRRTKGAQIV